LGAFDGVLKAAEELLEVFAALDEIDVGGVDDQEVGGGVAEEEMFVGAGDFLDVFGGDVGFVAGGFFGDAGAEDFGLGLEIDDQIGSGNVRGKGGVIALVELQLFVVEIEVGERTGPGASTARASRRRFWRSRRKYIWARKAEPGLAL